MMEVRSADSAPSIQAGQEQKEELSIYKMSNSYDSISIHSCLSQFQLLGLSAQLIFLIVMLQVLFTIPCDDQFINLVVSC